MYMSILIKEKSNLKYILCYEVQYVGHKFM